MNSDVTVGGVNWQSHLAARGCPLSPRSPMPAWVWTWRCHSSVGDRHMEETLKGWLHSEPLRYRHENQADRDQNIPPALKTRVEVRCAESGSPVPPSPFPTIWLSTLTAGPAPPTRTGIPPGAPGVCAACRRRPERKGELPLSVFPAHREETWLCHGHGAGRGGTGSLSGVADLPAEGQGATSLDLA